MLGVQKLQDLVGRTDLLKVRSDTSDKAGLLNFSAILKSALTMKPNTNIVGGSVAQVK